MPRCTLMLYSLFNICLDILSQRHPKYRKSRLIIHLYQFHQPATKKSVLSSLILYPLPVCNFKSLKTNKTKLSNPLHFISLPPAQSKLILQLLFYNIYTASINIHFDMMSSLMIFLQFSIFLKTKTKLLIRFVTFQGHRLRSCHIPSHSLDSNHSSYFKFLELDIILLP